jgi:hypothetical protein
MLEITKDLGMIKDSGGTTRRWCIAKCSYCDNESEHRTQSIKNKKSCGCATHLKASRLSHGMSSTRQYQTWADLKDRCDNIKNKSYVRYGARGISYDPSWKTFEGFWEDMKDGYTDGLTIERKDNNIGYTKANCTWITLQEQVNNRHTVNTFKQRDATTYTSKVTTAEIAEYGELYREAKYGTKGDIMRQMAKDLCLSENTAKTYLAKYIKGTLCKLT